MFLAVSSILPARFPDSIHSMELSTRERMQRMLDHKDADRVPITDSPWGATLARWHREGLPDGVDWAEHFGLDRFVSMWVDNSPRLPTRVIEETDEYVIRVSDWGVTMKDWKNRGGVPEFLDFAVKGPDSWRDAKARMVPSRDRVDWKRLRAEYPTWREQGAWITAEFWFGFDITHSWFVGTERVLEAIHEEPEWLADIFNHCLDVDLALYEMIYDEGYRFDAIKWPDDMGYKGHQFFSTKTYRELLKPVHKRAADWAHAHGAKVELHSCGDIRPLVPELIDIGIDILNPIEVKAGMDPVLLKKTYGDKLVFHGGINAALYWHPEKLWEHMREVVPAMKENGGYVLSSDHSVPDSVSYEQFRQFVACAKELAAY
jgi:uroporphyrinogen decarboxylase